MASTIPELVFSRKWKLGYKGKLFESSEIRERARKLAVGLKELGIKKGDRIAILSKNRPEWVIADLAVLSLGAVVVTIHHNLDTGTIKYIINDSKPKLLIADDKECIKGISARKPVMIDEMDKLFRDGKGIKEKVSRNDVATVVYTSGTTGMPKGVILTHGNILSNVEVIEIPLENEVALSYLPLSHMFERTALYYELSKGSEVHFSEGFHHLKDELKVIKPTMMTTVPLLLERIERAVEWLPKPMARFIVRRKLKRLRFFVCGGAHLHEETEKLFPHFSERLNCFFSKDNLTNKNKIIILMKSTHLCRY